MNFSEEDELLELLLQEEGLELEVKSEQEILPRKQTENIPLSFAQERLWFLDQLEGESATYNVTAGLRLQGALHVEALERSFTEIVRRHEALRTTFEAGEGIPTQKILPPRSVTIPLTDLQDFRAEALQAKIQRLADEESLFHFDLARGPLLRSRLLRVNEQEHVLLVTMHHIISDGWSLGIFIRELAALYEAFSRGRAAALPELPIQYADFACWQREWLSGETREKLLNYWETQLTGAPTLLELPTDRPRPPIQSFEGDVEHFELDAELTGKLRALNQECDATLFMTLLAVFNILLSRYSRQEDIVLSTSIANRNHVEIEPLIGFFLNALVLRTDLSGNPSFRELLARVRQMTLDAYTHQDLPFEVLVDKLQPERNLSYNPIFQVMFQLQNVPMGELALPGLTISPLEMERFTSRFDLFLPMVETENGLEGDLEYNTDIFERSTIQRMIEHFRLLLEGVAANPDQGIRQIPLLSDAERRQILCEWNATENSTYPLERCVHRLIEEQVENSPDAVAVTFEKDQLTYQELNQRASQVAHYLQSLGVEPETLVGICVERSFEMIIGLLGIMKAGGAYVPLDPEYPKERLAFMLEDSQVSVLLTQQKLLADLPAREALQTVCLDADWERIARESADNPESGVSADNLIYMIYTSGSTGRPKGALNVHRALVNRLCWMQEAYQLRPDDRILQKTPFSFDVSGWEFWWPLLTGASLVFAKPGGHKESAYLVDLIAEEQISTMHFVPSMLQVFLEEQHLERCSSLKRVICSGEALPADLRNRFFERLCHDVDLHNLYGPTEAAIDVTYWQCQRESQRPNVPIGRPIANTRIYILDEFMQAVPVGVAGELYIGGVNLARGYLNRPELTQEKFIPSPFDDDPASRLYKTGDLCRFLPDGSLEYLGRLDFQVKIRGLRIELGEIENALLSHPALREAVVLVHEASSGDKRLAAYLVAEQGQCLRIDDLRGSLKTRLPDYMVPSFFIPLDALPLTPNGKVDRRALPSPDTSVRTSEREYVAPGTPTEEALVEIWSTILGVQQIGIHDNFFEIGGHSLLGTQVTAHIHQRFQVELPLRKLFEIPTIEELAKYVDNVLWATNPESSSVPDDDEEAELEEMEF